MLELAIGLGIVGLGALVTSFIFDELTEEEKSKKEDMEVDYAYYKDRKEQELKKILEKYNITKEELYKSNDIKILSIKKEYFENIKGETLNFIDDLENNIDEQIKLKEEIKEEIGKSIKRLNDMRKNQTSSLRQEAMESLERELYEAFNKSKAYISYIKGYKAYLYDYKNGKKIDDNFKMMSFLLPKDYPYVGKLIYYPKSYLSTENILECIEETVNIKYNYCEKDIIKELDDNTLIPVLISESNFNRTTYLMEYTLSASKGYFKDIAMNQNRIGIEAKVKEYRELKNGNTAIILEYKGLELLLYRKDLEIPKRTPPCGTVLRVYPKKWTCDLHSIPEVSEKFQDSLKSFQFNTLPVIMSEENRVEFIKYIEDNKVDVSNDEWKIGPYDEDDIPEVHKFKFQLGNEMMFTASIEEKEQLTFKFIEMLTRDSFFSPEDIFIVMEATLSIAYDEDINEFEKENFDNIQNLLLMLSNEFKVQKVLKTSYKGMVYFNKWAEINNKLIHYLEKGKFIYCEIDELFYDKKDKKSGISIYKANIKNIETVREYLNSVNKIHFTGFFIENNKGDYIPVEFSATGDEMKIFTDNQELIKEKGFNVFIKVIPYPEIQQNKALQEFRSGILTNSNLQSYILDSSNIVNKKSNDRVLNFYNKALLNNLPQKKTVVNAIEQKEIFFIQGPPGTGKTTVIREIVMQFIENHPNDRILIVSQANVAIDNVLRGIPDELFPNMIRCGKEDKIDENLKEISFENKYNDYVNKINNKNLHDDIALEMWKDIVNKGSGKYNSVVGELILKKHNIIGATCVGLAQKQIGLDRLEFELVIIDEVGKALPSEVLIPLNKAKKVIMIGDHKQLPPTINPILFDEEKIELSDKEYCRDELFEKCLFENLYENCPNSNKSILKTQYRMPDVIGTMISHLFYNGEIENGEVTKHKLPIFFKKNINILDMSNEKLFRETKEYGNYIINSKELEVIYEVLKLMIEKIDNHTKIAVLSPYKKQKNLIISYLIENGIDIREKNIVVNTIDAFQGEEAEVVIYCTTRAIKKTKYFSDLARLNVALSRTKNDLLIIGSVNYFKSYGKKHTLYKIVDYVKRYGKIIKYSTNLEMTIKKYIK